MNLSFFTRLSGFTIVSLYIFGCTCLQQTHSLKAKDSWCTALGSACGNTELNRVGEVKEAAVGPKLLQMADLCSG